MRAIDGFETLHHYCRPTTKRDVKMNGKIKLDVTRWCAWLAIGAICIVLTGCQNTMHAHIVGDSRFLDVFYEGGRLFVSAILFVVFAMFCHYWNNQPLAKISWIIALVLFVGGCIYGYIRTGEPCELPTEIGQLNDCPSYKNGLHP